MNTPEILESVFPRFTALRRAGRCPFCETKDLGRETFRDELSWREFNISGLCQKCQDDIFSNLPEE